MSFDWLLQRANFCSKALLSSGAMYGGFMTLDQRRKIAAMAQEHERALLIQTLKDTIREKDQFMSMLSHELRTPMNGVIGLSEALLCGNCGVLSEKTSTFISTIHQSSCLLLNMINDILDAAAMNHGKLAIRHEKVNMASLVGQVVDTLSHMAKNEVQIVKDLQQIPDIMGDGGRITQILFNLIGNALKFTEHGNVVIRVAPHGDYVKLIVTDTGCGIPKDKHVQIFQPFEQADMSTTRKYGGTGLGLHIVKVLVEAHNGTIKVDSESGFGATFTVTLPVDAQAFEAAGALASRHILANRPKVPSGTLQLHRFGSFPLRTSLHDSAKSTSRADVLVIQDQQQPQPQHPGVSWDESAKTPPKNRIEGSNSISPKPSATSPPLSQRSSKFWSACKPTHSEVYGTKLAVIIDDDEIGHLVVGQGLEPLGYKMTAFGDAPSALQWLQQQDFVPDIVLLDYMMPEMSGIEFCTIFRETVPRSVVPVIMISAKTEEQSIVQALNAGCNDFITKPVRREELNARVDLHTAMKTDASWLKGLMNGSTIQDTEAMQLLQAIMPQKIIAKIQNGQKFIAETHPHVVVLFSDIVGFTTLSSKLPTTEIFMLLSNMFAAFDRLVDRFGIYKVETIGDAYMAVAGHDEDAAKGSMGRPVERMIQMACAMLDVVNDLTMLDGSKVKIRIGIHCGAAFSGVISLKCPRYCFVGDTINTASRMESSGFSMTVHVSDAIFSDLHDTTQLVPCGSRSIKGKGDMKTYLVKVGQWKQGFSTVTNITDGLGSRRHSVESRAQQQDVERLTSELAAAKADFEKEFAEKDKLVRSLEEQLKHALAQGQLESTQARQDYIALCKTKELLAATEDKLQSKEALCVQLQEQLQHVSSFHKAKAVFEQPGQEHQTAATLADGTNETIKAQKLPATNAATIKVNGSADEPKAVPALVQVHPLVASGTSGLPTLPQQGHSPAMAFTVGTQGLKGIDIRMDFA
ncbi:hypothetical protein WJX84_006862 [Apatococcus fuscideae]|uniref:histidine kinase n=1 Tax=Apatococcus fuscideae TaxID=2026836 RepID=A0AAW1SMV3_9CHLO